VRPHTINCTPVVPRSARVCFCILALGQGPWLASGSRFIERRACRVMGLVEISFRGTSRSGIGFDPSSSKVNHDAAQNREAVRVALPPMDDNNLFAPDFSGEVRHR